MSLVSDLYTFSISFACKKNMEMNRGMKKDRGKHDKL